MGNKVTNSSFSSALTGEFEHRSAKKLLTAIRVDDPALAQKAIDSAKAEFSRPVSSNSNRADYDDMINEMKNYLTRQYDVGDGPLFTRSPVEYAKHLKAQKVEQVITRNIMELEGLIPGSGPKFNQAVGEVTHERAALAKARLQAFNKDAKK
jgi:hypothetical protein